MKVILLKGVPKVGKPEEIVEVNDGFAQNALFPRKLAIPATPGAIAALTEKKKGRESQKMEQRALLDAVIKNLADKELTLSTPANDKGSLFSKIDAKVIADFLMHEHRVSIDAAHIQVPDGVIKKTGTYDIVVHDGEDRSVVSLTIAAK